MKYFNLVWLIVCEVLKKTGAHKCSIFLNFFLFLTSTLSNFKGFTFWRRFIFEWLSFYTDGAISNHERVWKGIVGGKNLKLQLQERSHWPATKKNELNHTILQFSSRFKENWAQSGRNETRFKNSNQIWLQTYIGFKQHNDDSHKRGCTETTFESNCYRSKRFKTANIRNYFSAVELGFATKINLRAEGHLSASKLLQDVLRSPYRAGIHKKAYQQHESRSMMKMSEEEAISTVVKAKLTRHRLIQSQKMLSCV